ncbi:MAG: neutral zinc metallopeptidase [Acidobacteria bacterium]|nr:neutral zinc metallopeptidase [Acidobacteriota bacterium]
MRWRESRQSDNVEDRRGMGRGGLAIGGGLGTVLLLVAALIFGGDPRKILEDAQNNPPQQTQQSQQQNDEGKQFVASVLGSTEDVWGQLFQQNGRQYRKPKLVLFTGDVDSACGQTSAAVGPFYCPGDEKVYIDLSFYRELKERFRAPRDFAQAYVIAHEVGHHVQKLLGISDRIDAQRRRMSETEFNQLSVRLELQADFFAGVWAHYAEQKGLLEVGDVEEALQAATAIGDDRLQRETQGYVVPDSFTHGTSEQRVRWFRKGYQTGDMRQGDTFNTRSL